MRLSKIPVWFCLVAAYAQVPKGGIVGTVLSPMDTPVANASITLTVTATGVKLTATTNPNGEFALATLAPGLYDLTLNASGFKPFIRHSLQVGETTSHMEISLEPKEDLAGNIKQLEIATTLKPDEYAGHFSLAQAYLAGGDVEKAQVQFEKVITLKPDYLPARLALSQLALRKREARTALTYAQQVLQVTHDSRRAALLAASALLQMGKLDEAKGLLSELIKDNPNHVEALLAIGMLELSQKHFKEAEEPFRRAYAIDPVNLAGLEGLVQIRMLMNEPQKAVALVADEVAKDPQRRDLHKELAATEVKTEQFDKAITEYQSLLEKSQDAPKEQADVLARLADALAQSGDMPHAIEQMKKAVQLAPENTVLMATLAALYDRAGKKQEAIAAYKAVLKVEPNNAIVMNNVAYVMAESGGDLDEALNMAQLARRQLPNFGAVLDTIGWIYLKKDLVDSAARVFEDLVEKNPTVSTFRYHWALALEKKGDREGARKQLELAMQNSPGKQELELIKALLKKVS